MSSSIDTDLRLRERRLALAAPTFATAAFLHAKAREELLHRLQPVGLSPRQILDLGGGTGLGARALADQYRKAKVTLVDHSAAMLSAAARARGWWRRFECVQAEATALPMADASVDLVVANLLLPYLSSPQQLFAEVRRVLKPRGYFAFTTLGAPTLKEVRAAYSSVDQVVHVSDFMDFHDLGDALSGAGFVAPVLDADRLTVTYTALADVCRDLRAAGATPPAGRKTMTGARRFARAADIFAAGAAADGRIPVTCELVFGQAWAPDGDSPARRIGDREVVVPLTQLRRRS